MMKEEKGEGKKNISKFIMYFDNTWLAGHNTRPYNNGFFQN